MIFTFIFSSKQKNRKTDVTEERQSGERQREIGDWKRETEREIEREK